MTTEGARVALITGANQGLGKETARRLGRRGLAVLVGARDPDRGEAAAQELRGQGIDARALPIDVTDQATIERARERIEDEFGRLDVLINNAGVNFDARRPQGSPGGQGRPSQTPADVLRRTYETNVFGAIAVTNAMVDLLRRSPAARVVNVSSERGSNTRWNDPDFPARRYGMHFAYDTSKAALNAATVHYALEFAGTAIKVNAAAPGYVATEGNDHHGLMTVEDERSVAAIVQLATLPDDGPTGVFLSAGGPVPW